MQKWALIFNKIKARLSELKSVQKNEPMFGRETETQLRVIL